MHWQIPKMQVPTSTGEGEAGGTGNQGVQTGSVDSKTGATAADWETRAFHMISRGTRIPDTS